jgi:hypothetical protein
MPRKRTVDCDRFRGARASELERLASILDREGIVVSSAPLYRAANQCRTDIPYGKNLFWRYRVDNLIIPIGKQSGVIPDKFSKTDFNVDLTVDVVGKCLPDDFSNEEADPLRGLAVDIIIRPNLAGKIKELCAFHIDRHIRADKDFSAAGMVPPKTRENHPTYHVQFGGHRLKLLDAEIVGVFFPEAPRLKHPPLEAFLAIDFILANFRGDLRDSLHGADPFIPRTIRNLQAMLWRPYIKSLISSWDAAPSEIWVPSELWPELC